MTSINWYKQNASEFITATSNLDLSAIYERFLPLLPARGRILDFGCGSGRDSLFFAQSDFDVLAIDPCEDFVSHLQDLIHPGIEEHLKVIQGTIIDLKQIEYFDGIWACASLLHLTKSELPTVLSQLAKVLKPTGFLYASFKRGSYEGQRNGRYFSDLEPEQAGVLISQTPGLYLYEMWVTEDIRPDRTEQWVNILARAQF